MPMTMPKITGCDASDCAYNIDKKCHALAITVGDSGCAMCDTFIKSGIQGGAPDMTGAVGACKASTCRFNKSLECTAGSIIVGLHSTHADCKTFAAK